MTRLITIVALVLGIGVALVAVTRDIGEEAPVASILNGIETDPLLDEGYVPERVETASLAMGCFWGPDGLFGVLPGVVRTRVGYAGGSTELPSYHSIGDHTETLQIDFDPSIITYGQLLELFWVSHDPYDGAHSTQYRSLILVHSDEQREAASLLIERATAETGRRPLTEIVPIGVFTRAESYHQKYRLQSLGRLREVVEELISGLGSFDAFVDSTVAARLNGYVAGWAPRDRLVREIEGFGLSERSQAAVLAAIQ